MTEVKRVGDWPAYVYESVGIVSLRRPVRKKTTVEVKDSASRQATGGVDPATLYSRGDLGNESVLRTSVGSGLKSSQQQPPARTVCSAAGKEAVTRQTRRRQQAPALDPLQELRLPYIHALSSVPLRDKELWVSLAVADCLVLVAAVPNEVLSYYLVGGLWLWGEAGCALFVFCQNLGINASSLSLVAFTAERYIAVCHPLRAHKMCTMSRARRITAGVWTFATLYCAPWLALTTTRPLLYRGHRAARRCDFKLPRDHYLAYFFADLLLFYAAPLLLSCALYALIARALLRSGGRSAARGEGYNPNSSKAGVLCRAQVVKMLAAVVFVFAILWLPYRGMLVYNSFAVLFSGPKFMDLWFLMFAKTCIYINCAINPFLYNAMSARFRRAFHKMLVCTSAEGRAYSSSYSNPRVSSFKSKSVRSQRSADVEHNTVNTTEI
ncbi:thyrotropin-releasing hormone receptor-like [Bacillus rossius redtenbacheri]|uniref:thyrotropin-releasing hormone receptor-like n=1 Tax=Bacillus rossius redtenbacheri TaxID=93214 RepID=UPI002FDDB602